MAPHVLNDRRPSEGVRRAIVYKELPSYQVNPEAKPTAKTCRQADRLFEKRVSKATCLKRSKTAEKQAYFRCLVHAGKRAHHSGGCVRYPRNKNHPQWTHARQQVVDAAVEADVFEDVRSPRGSPKMSRLIPAAAVFDERTEADPWKFDPDRQTELVVLTSRGTKESIDFDPDHPVAARYQTRLERVNDVLSRFEFTYRPYDRWDRRLSQERRQLRPVFFAKFTDGFDLHGRLYTGRYGHQSLRKEERATIRFDGVRSAELDFSGMHTRMLYHLEGIAYDDDPYALWGHGTTGPQRLMAKVLVNSLINARSVDSAIRACNYAMCSRTKPDGQGRRAWKTGRKREEAETLREAQSETGLKFADLVPLVMRRHRRIAGRFGEDMGVRLMRIDGAIALAVMTQFAAMCVPCLGVHDSFIVPRPWRAELKRVMLAAYKRRLGFLPVIRRND